MIVKIQLPIFEDALALIYNESKSVFYRMPPTKDLKRIMKGRKKAYFYAGIGRETRLLRIRKEAKPQNW